MLGIADWAASGLASTPWTLAVASVFGGALAGILAGAMGAVLARPGLALGLVLAGGIGLEGLSIASKELERTELTLAVCLVLALAVIALVLCLRRRDEASPGAGLSALAALPAFAWLAVWIADAPWVRVLATAVPVLWVALATHARAQRAHALGWALPLAVLFLAQLGPSRGARPTHAPPSSARPAPATGPSIVLLVIDTLRADAVSPGGTLAAFAREGVEFRQCVSAASWTLPSVGSLLTGLLPSQHGAVTSATPLGEDVTTLAELLREAGYATAAFTGGAFVGAAHRLDQGFDAFDSSCERRFPAFGKHVPLVWRFAKNRYLPQRWLLRAVDEARGLSGVLEAARAWAEAEPRGPKFLLLHTYQVHDYYLYDPDLDDAVLAARPPPSTTFAGRVSVNPSEFVGALQEDLEYFRALYLGRATAVERLFPELVAALTPHVGEDAVWVVTADHGEGFDAAERRVHHGGRLHEDLLRVPLILRAKGRIAAGRVVEESVRSIDVMPTLLELAGVSAPEGLAGESLLAALDGTRSFPASAFAEDQANGFDMLALRRDGWKCIRMRRDEVLYDLRSDVHERTPVGQPAPIELQEEMASFPTRYPARVRAEIELDEATLEHLRSLGYVR